MVEYQNKSLRWVLTVAFATAKQASVDTDLTSVLLMMDFTRFKFKTCTYGTCSHLISISNLKRVHSSAKHSYQGRLGAIIDGSFCLSAFHSFKTSPKTLKFKF
jgi:hypothetical protein